LKEEDVDVKEEEEINQMNREDDEFVTTAEDQIEKEIRRRVQAKIKKDKERKVNNEQRTDDLITFSDLPSSAWSSIVHIDTIKERNKPKETVSKKIKNAPFFLPVQSGLNPQFKVEEQATESRIRSVAPTELSPFARLLVDGRYSEGIDFLKELTPSGVDFNILMLNGTEEMAAFLMMLHYQLNMNTSFELVQAYMSSFLKHHSDTVLMNEEMHSQVVSLKEAQDTHWQRLQSLFNMNSCLLNFFCGNQ